MSPPEKNEETLDNAKMLEYAHKLRLAGFEKESALRQTISFGRKIK